MISIDARHHERRAFRARRVRLAFVTSLGSKALGVVVQFLAVPLAVRSLGAERFGIYTMLVSALVWIDLGRLGIGPGLTRELAVAWNQGDRGRERRLFSTAVLMLMGIAGVLAGLLACAMAAGWDHVALLFGPSAARFGPEIRSGMIVVAAFLVAQIAFSAGEAARSAYQDDFVNNGMSALANLISLVLIFAVALFRPTVPAFALAVFGAIACGKAVNFLVLVGRSRPYLMPRIACADRGVLGPLLGTSLAFWLAQLATLLMHNISLVQLGRLIGADGLAPFAVAFRLLQLLSTAVLMFSLPLWPAVTDAVVRGDIAWVRAARRRLIRAAMAYACAVGLGLALFGTMLIPLWVGKGLPQSMPLDAALGLYFVIWMWNHCHVTLLFGLGELWTVAWTTLVEGVLVLVLAGLMVPRFGATGTALALCIAGLASSAWLLPLAVARRLAADGPALHPRPVDASAALPPPAVEPTV